MKITKFGHSCVMVQDDDRSVIYDPGIFTSKLGKLDVDDIDRLDRIVITHAHGDHFDPELVNSLLQKFPEAQIIAMQEVLNAIKDAGVEATMRTESQCCIPFTANHQRIPVGEAPANSGYHFKDKLTHPGDSNSFNETKDVLLMPFVAPWGSVVEGVDKVKELKPQTVIPIHDWFFHDDAIDWLNGLLVKSFDGTGINVVTIKPGESIEI